MPIGTQREFAAQRHGALVVGRRSARFDGGSVIRVGVSDHARSVRNRLGGSDDAHNQVAFLVVLRNPDGVRGP